MTQQRIPQNNLPNFWTIRLRQTILLHLTEIAEMYYSKHPQKLANQEFSKTASTTFGPSVWDINDSAPSHRNGLFKTSPKMTQLRIPQNDFPRFRTLYAIFSSIYKSAA